MLGLQKTGFLVMKKVHKWGPGKAGESPHFVEPYRTVQDHIRSPRTVNILYLSGLKMMAPILLSPCERSE